MAGGKCLFSEEDIKEALKRRGPDSLGAKNVYLYLEVDDERKDCIVQSFVQKEGAVENGCGSELRGELGFIGATLQLRGVNPVVQPLTDPFGNVLVYNGEIFGGINFSSDSNDMEVLMQSLGQCCSCISHEDSRSSCHFGGSQKSVPQLLSTIRGPWALIYWQDLNIGIALWLAAGGDGWLYEETSSNGRAQCLRVKYKSEARILLVGSGADEQCAGYGRHRTKYRNRSWLGLHEEMKLDMQRIWKRNLGRDDRCIADNGKEARFPFLDEDVIRTLLDIPLWEIADLNQPSGLGDKKILREVARLLGLKEAASLPKRAIQFGSRIARESNRKNFGSNRAANQASAGSVVIHGSSD
ncbi:UNVERIFIED_CONTAM: Asparagine synthetase domain-containing protein 1 [Sesamum radiatum]|uniref:Asparagine synthetase domain-containing protein 1 n=1 Tax=Sesamum radiatum TaxID=300843 RepID=A0AAW2MXT1_SESRA